MNAFSMFSVSAVESTKLLVHLPKTLRMNEMTIMGKMLNLYKILEEDCPFTTFFFQ